ncbi:hypothetical protein EVAR_80267_1 [Eumeta japonica]|uniref:MADF domain-containing protein n=1 Tax=Eumeta variegata TaxID=151549 RepID=A0A4C1UBY4_EUMVA|nr:hypothetical protein EVAR_80267_1 [Eumeta japonica]
MDAWKEIATEMNKTAEECKKKMVNLLSSFRREKAKTNKSLTTGSCQADVYKSTWFAYKSMEFLMDRDTPRKRLNTITNENIGNISNDDENSLTRPVTPIEALSPSSDQQKTVTQPSQKKKKQDKKFQLMKDNLNYRYRVHPCDLPRCKHRRVQTSRTKEVRPRGLCKDAPRCPDEPNKEAFNDARWMTGHVGHPRPPSASHAPQTPMFQTKEP